MRQPDSDNDARDFDDCAESHRVAQAHTLPLEGEPRAVTAPTVAAHFFCFKCLSTDALPFHKSAPYLAAKLYLCPSCIRPAKKHPPDTTFDCGCTETRSAHVEKHWLPPNPACPACSGTGKISDKHTYLKIKRDVGECTPGGERQGHSYQSTTEEEVDPLLLTFPDGGWLIDAPIQSTGRRPGRPKTTTPNLEVTKIYMVDVANEVAEKYQWILKLEREDFLFALNTVTNIMLARGKSANPRLLAEWLPFSKNTIYRRREKGRNMDIARDLERFEALRRKVEGPSIAERLDTIQGMLERQMAVDELRWIELFRQHGDFDEDFELDVDEV